MSIKPGARLKSAVCSTEVMVVKSIAGSTLYCGGTAMLLPGEAGSEGLHLDPQNSSGSIVGKRYVNGDQTFEALCVKAGGGSLTLDGVALTIKESKKLPSSD